jgi:hypothetical protein
MSGFLSMPLTGGNPAISGTPWQVSHQHIGQKGARQFEMHQAGVIFSNISFLSKHIK